MQKYIDDFMQHLKYERNLSEHTLRNYESDLVQFHDHLAPPDKFGSRREVEIRALDNLTIREFMASLYEKKKKKSSIHRKIAALRTFFRFLCREGVLEVNPARLVASPRVDRQLPNHLTIEEMIKFIETPETETVLGKRDRAMLELLYASGVRVSELVNLSLIDIDFAHQTVRVKGKGRKERVVPLWTETARILQAWFRELGDRVDAVAFPNARGQPLSRDGVDYLLRRAVSSAAQSCPSLKTKRVSPHVLRHTTAMHLLQAGVDVAVIALWLGHESIETTHVYVEADLATKERALEKLEPVDTRFARYRADDALLDFLANL